MQIHYLKWRGVAADGLIHFWCGGAFWCAKLLFCREKFVLVFLAFVNSHYVLGCSHGCGKDSCWTPLQSLDSSCFSSCWWYFIHLINYSCFVSVWWGFSSGRMSCQVLTGSVFWIRCQSNRCFGSKLGVVSPGREENRSAGGHLQYIAWIYSSVSFLPLSWQFSVAT